MSIIKTKKIFFLFAILLINIQLHAENVSNNKAKQVAVNFFKYTLEIKKINRSVIVENIIKNNFQNILCYYTVCFENGGYVNIAATDASIPILSYSLSGNILPLENSPPAYIEWMEGYKREIFSIITNNVDNSHTIVKWEKILDNKDFPAKDIIVGPLTTSEWGQSMSNDFNCPGYNFLMPNNGGCTCQRCSAGCVAIAMAQILYYWKHPINVGFYTYYDWCNMNETLTQDENENFENELTAVSALVYDCAESVDMEYCIEDCASGASIKDAVNAFKLLFGYHNDIDYKRKWWYSNNNWKNFIKNDINNGQPIIYRGEGSGGHAFICDGYEESNDDYFHFNWGSYGDYFEEWFTIDDLTPGNNNFNKRQAAIFHIKPNPDIYINYCNIGLNLFNLYDIYYSSGGTLNPWEIVPETMQNLYSCNYLAPERWRTIPNGITAQYVAHNKIVLSAGFKAETGSNFLAQLTPCLNCESKENRAINVQDFAIIKEISNFKNIKINEERDLEKSEKSFMIYPNPNPGIFNIQLYEEGVSEFSVEVINTMGNTVYREQNIYSVKTQINIQSQSKGIYFVKIEANGRLYTKKVVYE